MASPGGSLAMLWLQRYPTQLLHHITAAFHACYSFVYACTAQYVLTLDLSSQELYAVAAKVPAL